MGLERYKKEELLKKAIEVFEIEDTEYLGSYPDKLIYCYMNGIDLVDCDLWFEYEELLDESISYAEYLAVYSDDYVPTSVMRETLEKFREEQKKVANITVHGLVKEYEFGNGIREFEIDQMYIDENMAVKSFNHEFRENKIFDELGIYHEWKNGVSSEYEGGIGMMKLEIDSQTINFSKAQFRELLAGVDKEVLRECLPEELASSLSVKSQPAHDELKIKVDGGYLVAGRNTDPDYDGIYIVYETNDGDIVDVVLTEAKSEFDKKKIDVYCYENVQTEEFTKKYTLDTKEIYEAINGFELESKPSEMSLENKGLIDTLCESLNKHYDLPEEGRAIKNFTEVFESDKHLCAYYYDEYFESEFYLVSKSTRDIEKIMDNSPDFVGYNSFKALENDVNIQVKHPALMKALVEVASNYSDGILQEAELGGLRKAKKALEDAVKEKAVSLDSKIVGAKKDISVENGVDKEKDAEPIR